MEKKINNNKIIKNKFYFYLFLTPLIIFIFSLFLFEFIKFEYKSSIEKRIIILKSIENAKKLNKINLEYKKTLESENENIKKIYNILKREKSKFSQIINLIIDSSYLYNFKYEKSCNENKIKYGEDVFIEKNYMISSDSKNAKEILTFLNKLNENIPGIINISSLQINRSQPPLSKEKFKKFISSQKKLRNGIKLFNSEIILKIILPKSLNKNFE